MIIVFIYILVWFFDVYVDKLDYVLNIWCFGCVVFSCWKGEGIVSSCREKIFWGGGNVVWLFVLGLGIIKLLL